VTAQDGNMIGVRLSPFNHLFLTQTEADSLANRLRQTLICRTIDQANHLVTLADISLTVAEAWGLLDRLDTSNNEIVDWPAEGF
jgi:hypothetical protein